MISGSLVPVTPKQITFSCITFRLLRACSAFYLWQTCRSYFKSSKSVEPTPVQEVDEHLILCWMFGCYCYLHGIDYLVDYSLHVHLMNRLAKYDSGLLVQTMLFYAMQALHGLFGAVSSMLLRNWVVCRLCLTASTDL